MKRARQGQLKLDAEINHAPNYSLWSVLRLDTFIQGNNSGVTQGNSLSKEPRGQVRLVLWKTKEECEPE
jgi:hypothetical protein